MRRCRLLAGPERAGCICLPLSLLIASTAQFCAHRFPCSLLLVPVVRLLPLILCMALPLPRIDPTSHTRRVLSRRTPGQRRQGWCGPACALPALTHPHTTPGALSSPILLGAGSSSNQRAVAAGPPPPSSSASPPTQAPTAALQASHTSISLPLGPIDLFGNYSIIGPAVIRKINNALVALVQPGGAVSVLNSSSAGPTYMPCASLSHDEDTSAVVNLSGQHLELDGSFELHHMSQRTIEHDGKVIVSPATLSEDSCILLLPGGCVSHPVNVHPQQKRP